MDIKIKLIPSSIGAFFENKCVSNLVFKSVSEIDCGENRLDWKDILKYKTEFKSSGAAAKKGEDWEYKIFKQVCSTKTDPFGNACCIYEMKNEDLISALEKYKPDDDKPTYLYQAAFSIDSGDNNSFRKEYLDGADNIVLGQFKPDFLRLEYNAAAKKHTVTVIDVKNSASVKEAATVQITMYVIALEHLIRQAKLDYEVDTTGVIWNREVQRNANGVYTDELSEHTFPTVDVKAEIKRFFDKQVKGISSVFERFDSGKLIRKKLPFCVTQLCEYCPSFDECKARCKAGESVRMLPYITVEAQERLDRLIKERTLDNDSIDDVFELLEDDAGRKELTGGCTFWDRVYHEQGAYRNALSNLLNGNCSKERKTDASSFSLPSSQSFSLYLTAQQDVNTRRTAAFAWLLVPCKDNELYGDPRFLNSNGYVSIFDDSTDLTGYYYGSYIAESSDHKDIDHIEEQFVESIYGILDKISAADMQNDSLQGYVMDHYEYFNIESSLFDMMQRLDRVNDKQLLDKVMTILLWLQGERLVTESDRENEKIVDYPVSTLTTEISRLYVLPQEVSYSLRKSSLCFETDDPDLGKDIAFDSDDEPYFGVLTNAVKSEAIAAILNEKDKHNRDTMIKGLSKHLIKRLRIESRIVHTMQTELGAQQLPRSAESYSKPSFLFNGDPELAEAAKLYFETIYERMLKQNEIRSVRSSGIEYAINSGKILWLEYIGNERYKVLNKERFIGREWFSSRLCEDTPENRNTIRVWIDNKKSNFYKPGFGINENYKANGFDCFDDGTNVTLSVHLGDKPRLKPVEGNKYLLFETFYDKNSERALDAIKNLQKEQYKDLIFPEKLCRRTGIIYEDDTKAVCDRYSRIADHDFSGSQRKAFRHFLENRLTVLVGPPASGKTDFIARSLITLLGYYKEVHGQNLRVVVSANSHAAIDNVLLKLKKMCAHNSFIELYKVRSYNDHCASGDCTAMLRTEEKVKEILENAPEKPQIIGMTCWAASKICHEGNNINPFDVIVMDEASQIRSMDALITLECCNMDSARLLLVGDNDQLPPIISGRYPEKPGEKYIHGSIFRLYETALKNSSDPAAIQSIQQLNDNFRMNGILCKYSAIGIYGNRYKAYENDPAIRDQKISLKQTSDDDFLSFVLDPEYPLVFCELSGDEANQTKTEIEKVAGIVEELRDNLLTGNGRLASETESFWRESADLPGACGIICPHHEHISRLKTRIQPLFDADSGNSELYIGTVDKLQGQERTAVIVSYGISEKEKIKNEIEFIFSRNRFNVSITRGKAKTIIFLSDSMTRGNIIPKKQSDSVKEGIEFIKKFQKYMECEVNEIKGPDDITAEPSSEECISKCFDSDGVTINVYKKRLLPADGN